MEVPLCYDGHPWNWLLCELLIQLYSGHPWDMTSWLLYRGGLLIQWNLYIVVTLETQPVGCSLLLQHNSSHRLSESTTDSMSFT